MQFLSYRPIERKHVALQSINIVFKFLQNSCHNFDQKNLWKKLRLCLRGEEKEFDEFNSKNSIPGNVSIDFCTNLFHR